MIDLKYSFLELLWSMKTAIIYLQVPVSFRVFLLQFCNKKNSNRNDSCSKMALVIFVILQSLLFKKKYNKPLQFYNSWLWVIIFLWKTWARYEKILRELNWNTLYLSISIARIIIQIRLQIVFLPRIPLWVRALICLVVSGGFKQTFPINRSLGDVHKSTPGPFMGGARPTVFLRASGQSPKYTSTARVSPKTALTSLIVGASKVSRHCWRRQWYSLNSRSLWGGIGKRKEWMFFTHCEFVCQIPKLYLNLCWS